MTNLENNETCTDDTIFNSIIDDKWKNKLVEDNKMYKRNIDDIPTKHNLNQNKNENINIPVICFEERENITININIQKIQNDLN